MLELSQRLLRAVRLTLVQLFTVGAAVCMFVGKHE